LGRVGARARAKALTPERQSEIGKLANAAGNRNLNKAEKQRIAKAAAQARWAKKTNPDFRNSSQSIAHRHVAIHRVPFAGQFNPDDELLTPEQLAERLHVKVNWVWEQTRERTRVRTIDPLPYLKTGKYIRFNWREVCEWQTRHEGRESMRHQKGTIRKDKARGVWYGVYREDGLQTDGSVKRVQRVV
jgi:hypothetical protein